MTTRKFHRTVIQYEILSEDPISDLVSLEQIAGQCAEGDWSGQFLATSHQVLNGEECADALIAQGSDPEFFQIDEEGNDLSE